MTRHSMARMAGLLYLATVPTTGFSYGYIAFMPKNDPAMLLVALQFGRQSLDWSVLLGATGFVIYLLMAALFHRLLSPASKVGADLLVLFVAASVPLAFMGLAHRMELITLLDTATGQLPAEGMALLQAEASLFQICSIFWGLWMVPLGWLSYRVGLVPRWVGLLLVGGGFGYLSGFVLPVMGVTTPSMVAGSLTALTLGSEFLFMFWLMIKGAGTSQEPDADGAS